MAATPTKSGGCGASDATLDELFDEYTNEVEHRANTKKSIESAKRHFGELEGMAFKTKPNGRSAEKIELAKVKLPNWLKRPYREITQDDVLERFDVVSRMIPAASCRSRRSRSRARPTSISATCRRPTTTLSASTSCRARGS